jgi:hypothetical protein
MAKNKKTKLTVQQLRAIHVELNGDSSSGIKGLLQEKLPFVLKFHITTVAKIASDVYTTTEEMRLELVNQLGKLTPEGFINVKPTIIEKGKKGEPDKEVANPNYTKFIKEWTDVVQVEKEVEHHAFTIEEFEGLETDANYPEFFSLLDLN